MPRTSSDATVAEATGTVKSCRACGLVKPIESFPPNRAGHNGRQTYCRDCYRRYLSNYRAISRHRAERIVVVAESAEEIEGASDRWCRICSRTSADDEIVTYYRSGSYVCLDCVETGWLFKSYWRSPLTQKRLQAERAFQAALIAADQSQREAA